MKATLSIPLLLLLAQAPAVADPPPDFVPDGFGLYFDSDCSTSDMETADFYEVVEMYLCLVAPSRPDGVSGWECRVEIAGDIESPEWTLEAGVDQDPNDSGFRVEIPGAPLMPQDDIVRLATFTGLVASTLDIVLFYIYPPAGESLFQGVPGYLAGPAPGDPIPGEVAAGKPYGSVHSGSINYIDCGCNPNEPATWAGVKNLFR